jgi:hypothetical protein
MAQQSLAPAYRQTPWRLQLQFVGLFLLIVVLIGLVAGIYLNVTSRAATIGRRIQDMQEEIQLNHRLNADLETQLARLTSASAFELRAQDLGFREVTAPEVSYIEVPGYGGRQPATLAPPPSPIAANAQVLPIEFTQSLFEWLRELSEQPPFSLIRIGG